MLLVLAGMVVVIGVMRAFPDTEIGRALNRWLVEAPARGLNRLRRGRIAFYALLAMGGVGLVVLFEADGMRLFGFMLPDTLAWFALFDVGVFVDALLIAGTIAATNGIRAIRAQAIAVPRLVRTMARRGAARARRLPGSSSPPTEGPSDGDGRPWGVQTLPYRAFSIA
ncbi:hypothetical protein MMB232_00537 [Brevundimonas subvibrioides]|uniref:hypothetical protein n=1 Tax=Brevundimonas subvibrioides TaxID=74313 RepID=UPI0032D56AA5